MKYIADFKEGDHITGVYLCKQKVSALTRTGKAYDNVILQDKTGVIDAKIWDPNSPAIVDFDVMDYVALSGEVIVFSGNLQFNIRRSRPANPQEYKASDYFPVTDKDVDQMEAELVEIIGTIENPYIKALLEAFFLDEEFMKAFSYSSAAKTVHHAFIGGLLEHTLGVARLCDYMAKAYPYLKRDLLVGTALLHDIGKIKELSPYPLNDYTDEGQMLGHIVIGAQMVREKMAGIQDFPTVLGNEIVHCILAHHGELEFGSPKKPCLAEAIALNLADNTDAKLQTAREIYEQEHGRKEWLGFSRIFDSNMRRTDEV